MKDKKQNISLTNKKEDYNVIFIKSEDQKQNSIIKTGTSEFNKSESDTKNKTS